MEYRKSLITGFLGLAMLATPITAAAFDRDTRANTNNPPISRSFNVPTHADTWNSSQIVLVDDAREDRYERNHRWGNDGWRNYRRGYTYNRGYYGNRRYYSNRGYYGRGYYGRGYYGRGYYGSPYAMPRNYASGSCGWARHLRTVYNQDRYSGHPAAAADLLPRLRRAERACSGSSYGYYNRWHRY